MEAIIVGGGIGGLSLALSLHQAGIAVRVYEAVADPGPAGVGINLQPSAVRELTELGLGDQLADIGIATQQLILFNKFGQLIWHEPRGMAAGYRWPQYSIHRGQLQMLLLRAVRARIGEANFRGGMSFVALAQDRERVTAKFSDRSGVEVSDAADVLIGADGIHSAVRRQLYPHEGEPRFAQQVLWRAAVDAAPFLDGRTMVIAGHYDQRIIVYPVGTGARPGHLLTNWICQSVVPDTTARREDWNRCAPKEAVLAHFGLWQFPWLDLPALVRQTASIYEFPLVDRDPVATWTQDRVTLIGDAAHPMYPIGSQAGSQAIIDARALTGALMTSADPREALLRYDLERRPVMDDVTLRNRRFGPEAAMQLVEDRAPNGFDNIDDVISQQELAAITRSFSSAAGLDVETVNSRPSFVTAASTRRRRRLAGAE
jgi:5-methylphenazine-1-carboxylate 1-monooxygenase